MTTCTGTGRAIYSADLSQYDFGGEHPMSPSRVSLTFELAGQLGVVGDGGLPVVDAPTATDEELEWVHTPDLIEAVKRAARTGVADPRFGLGSEDVPIFDQMHTASARIAGASIEACRSVWSGEVTHAANLMGGLHHAKAAKASGFCVYNDAAVGIEWLLRNGARRVVYVDIDVHHGDGVESAFWNDPRVLTISIHESGQFLFPGTGFPKEIGGPDAQGSAVNIALPPGTDNAGWLRAFHAVVPELVEAFEPDVLVTQSGCDTHERDPMAHFMLSIEGQVTAYETLHRLSHEVCDGKWVALGGGGYSIGDVVPRAWTHLLATVGGQVIDPATPTPQAWRDQVAAELGIEAPLAMGDGRAATWSDWARGYDPDSWLDRQIGAVRRSVFPWHGLDPSNW